MLRGVAYAPCLTPYAYPHAFARAAIELRLSALKRIPPLPRLLSRSCAFAPPPGKAPATASKTVDKHRLLTRQHAREKDGRPVMSHAWHQSCMFTQSEPERGYCRYRLVQSIGVSFRPSFEHPGKTMALTDEPAKILAGISGRVVVVPSRKRI